MNSWLYSRRSARPAGPVWLDVALHLVLALWAGSMLGFAFLVAPNLFGYLPSRQLAGNLSGIVLAAMDRAILVAAGVSLAIALWQWRRELPGLANTLRVLLPALAIGLVLFSSLYVRPQLDAVQARQGGKPIEEFAPTDPLRLEYNRYHALSRQVFTVNTGIGALLIVLTAARRREAR